MASHSRSGRRANQCAIQFTPDLMAVRCIIRFRVAGRKRGSPAARSVSSRPVLQPAADVRHEFNRSSGAERTQSALLQAHAELPRSPFACVLATTCRRPFHCWDAEPDRAGKATYPLPVGPSADLIPAAKIDLSASSGLSTTRTARI